MSEPGVLTPTPCQMHTESTRDRFVWPFGFHLWIVISGAEHRPFIFSVPLLKLLPGGLTFSAFAPSLVSTWEILSRSCVSFNGCNMMEYELDKGLLRLLSVSAQMALLTRLRVLGGNTQTCPAENLLRLSPFMVSLTLRGCVPAGSVCDHTEVPPLRTSRGVSVWPEGTQTCWRQKPPNVRGHNWEARMGWTGWADRFTGLWWLIWD